MPHIAGFERDQLLLLPEAVDDYVDADKRLDDYLSRLDASDVEDGATTSGARTKNFAEKIGALRKKRGCYEAMRAKLDRTGEDQISLTDADSRAMAAHTKV